LRSGLIEAQIRPQLQPVGGHRDASPARWQVRTAPRSGLGWRFVCSQSLAFSLINRRYDYYKLLSPSRRRVFFAGLPQEHKVSS
jgi:hypothetical protein